MSDRNIYIYIYICIYIYIYIYISVRTKFPDESVRLNFNRKIPTRDLIFVIGSALY